MQTKLEVGKLLDENGRLKQAGYATFMAKDYCREDIKAGKMRIKEWDYYIVTNGKIALALTVADNSYMSLASASFLDLTKSSYKTTSEMKFFTFGKLNLPSSINEGDIYYDTKRAKIHFIKEKTRRQLVCVFNEFDKNTRLEANLILTDFPKDSMVIATPYAEDKLAFYYNCKINCMKASGYVKVGDTRYDFDEQDSFGTLDWGRGVWTYKNTWYWGSLSCQIDGHKVGFNIGYGFGDTSSASENMIFYDGIAHKTDRLTFNIPKKDNADDFLSTWTITSNDKRINLNFVPIIDRKDYTNIGILCTNQHQVFGKFSGTLTLDDGQTIQLNDCVGFAEKVYNKW
ncbi:MAG: DUF2804 domain-containing protein [Clostridia bacterium]